MLSFILIYISKSNDFYDFTRHNYPSYMTLFIKKNDYVVIKLPTKTASFFNWNEMYATLYIDSIDSDGRNNSYGPFDSYKNVIGVYFESERYDIRLVTENTYTELRIVFSPGVPKKNDFISDFPIFNYVLPENLSELKSPFIYDRDDGGDHSVIKVTASILGILFFLPAAYYLYILLFC